MTQTSKKQLYRSKARGRVAGVCAGIAEYIGMEVWLIRILWFSGLIFSGGFFFIAYIACWLILDKRYEDIARHNPQCKKNDQWHRFKAEQDIDKGVEVKTRVWKSGEPPQQAFRDIKRQFDGIESRVRNMESFVTSTAFSLKREINKL